MSLSDLKLRKILNKPQEKRFELADRDGLSVRVMESGSITFQYRYRFNRKAKRLKVGNYPAMSLSEARSKIPELRAKLEEGFDPALEKAEKKQRNLDSLSLVDCFDMFIDQHGHYSKETLKHYRSVLNQIKKRTWPVVDKISVAVWRDYFDSFELQKSAKVHYKKIKSCLNWAYEKHYIKLPTINELRGKTVGIEATTGQRVLLPSECNAMLESICFVSGSLAVKLCLSWIVLTGCRRGEAINLEWNDLNINERMWIIPGHKSKTGKMFRRPITDQMLQILDVVKHHTNNKGIVFAGGKNGTALGGTTVNDLNNRVKVMMKSKLGVLEDFSPHDLRRTLSTNLSELGIMPHVTEKMLGHELGGVMAVYNKHDWLAEQASAYEIWTNLIMPPSFVHFLNANGAQ